MFLIDIHAPYKFISFELEAYANEANIGYQKEIVDGANLWREFNKLTIFEKCKLAKQYYKNGRTYMFRYFVNNYVWPIVLHHKK